VEALSVRLAEAGRLLAQERPQAELEPALASVFSQMVEPLALLGSVAEALEHLHRQAELRVERER